MAMLPSSCRATTERASISKALMNACSASPISSSCSAHPARRKNTLRVGQEAASCCHASRARSNWPSSSRRNASSNNSCDIPTIVHYASGGSRLRHFNFVDHSIACAILKIRMSRAVRYLAIALALPLSAEKSFEFWPGAQYDSRIPTIQQVLGYNPGEQITSSSDILRYFDALAAASPRIQVFPYAQSWEKRQLMYAAIGSETNLKRLHEIRAAMQKLADPRKTSD